MRYLAITAILAMPGCAYNPPTPQQSAPATVTTISKPAASVWDRALAVLTESGYPIVVAQKESGLITTGSQVVRLTDAQADCGNIWGLPYVKDRRTLTGVAYSLRITDADGAARVVVNSTITGNFVSHAGATALRLDCRSLGQIEQDLLRRIGET